MQDLGFGPVALDTSILIYYLERHERFSQIVNPVFEAAAQREIALVTSAITLAEVLVLPLRASHRALARQYEQILGSSHGLTLVPITLSMLRAVAEIRAATAAKIPDALQLAAALSARCSVLLTNDRRLPSLPGLRILQLSDYA